jgi:uncharacterized protein (DUF1330 family)
MSAFFVVQATVSDEQQYKLYSAAVAPLIGKFGGKLVARQGAIEVLEGSHDTRPVLMVQFPDMDTIRAFWGSPEYASVKKLRDGAATIDVWAFPGHQSR